MLEIHRDKNVVQRESSKRTSAAWEESLHKLESIQDITDFFRALSSWDSESIDNKNPIMEARLLIIILRKQGILGNDFESRYTAEKSGKRAYFTLGFLSR